MFVCVYVYHIFFIHPSVDGHLSSFCVLATVNSTAMNVGVHESFWVVVFSRYVPKAGIAGLYGDYILSSFGHLHTILHSGCINIDLIFFSTKYTKKKGRVEIGQV